MFASPANLFLVDRHRATLVADRLVEHGTQGTALLVGEPGQVRLIVDYCPDGQGVEHRHVSARFGVQGGWLRRGGVWVPPPLMDRQGHPVTCPGRVPWLVRAR